MIAPPSVRLLVCGAADRGDEGAALAAVATLLPALPDRLLEVLEVRRCGALAVDDLTDVPEGVAAIVVDAALGVPPGGIVVVPLAALATQAAAVGPSSSHALAPDRLVALAADRRGGLPDGSFVGIGGKRFACGFRLSRAVRAGLPAFRAAIEDEIERLGSPSAGEAVPDDAGRMDPSEGPRVPQPAATLTRTLAS